MTRVLPAETARRVLLVEDDPGDAFLVQELLSEVDPEVDLTIAGSLAEVLERELWAAADCILLDLNTPGTTGGLDSLRQLLRADPSAAVCVLTGLDDEYLGIAAVGIGAQDYLVKGKADGAVLIRAIRYAIERRRAEAGLVRLREEQLAAAESVRLERGLMPTPLLAGSGVAARTFYRSGRTRSVIGGDFFDAVRDPRGRVHAIVGDVCGHGPDEAALGALLRVSWRALVLAGVDESQVLPNLQEVLVSERHDARLFTTVCTVAIAPNGSDSSDGSDGAGGALVRLAGHPPPVLLGPPPRTDPPPVGLPLGIDPAATWQAAEMSLDAGWSLLLYTDGLIEGRGPVPDEPLWEEGLLRLLETHASTPLDELPGRLVELAEGFNGGPLADDVAILLLSGEHLS
ncbi:PP2C family protein-serine/threonine phosphatase [Pseudonocardia dioxanivorans]|uniref:PP2C family protein-serine/threonine phosphatase n=1 Tax=Pseudonocardia dioxanivorans TaxID=240495 RepID=UPI0018F8B790|nr:SpoIIE family protein phosphatase [Pseudonocardia dioxanivorans]